MTMIRLWSLSRLLRRSAQGRRRRPLRVGGGLLAPRGVEGPLVGARTPKATKKKVEEEVVKKSPKVAVRGEVEGVSEASPPPEEAYEKTGRCGMVVVGEWR